MKKSLEKFKVRIDQNLNRSEKSIALTPDLLKIEETIGVYKQVCTTLQKKFSEGLQGFGKGTDGPSVDRRLKKTGDFILGQTLSEIGRGLLKQSSSSCLAQVLVEVGGLCNCLAQNQVNYDISVEQIIVGKLGEVLSTDLPNILGGRKQLDRYILELDTAKARLDKAKEEELHGAPGVGARIDRLVEDLDDTARKVEQTRDVLAADMLVFLARDSELAGIVTQYLEFRGNLNLDNSTQIGEIKPRLEMIRSTRRGFPIFGCALKDHISWFNLESGIAYPLQLCISKLIELGLDEEGLFRLAAGSSKVKRLRAEIDAGQATLSSLEGCDHHVLTAIIKTYLRELPSPLFGDELYQDWLETANLQGEDRFDGIWNLLQSEHLPRDNYRNIHYLFKFLHEVTRYSEKNKMTASNLAIVITPNVIWSTEEVQDVMDVGAGGVLAQVVELIILQQSWFFQNEKEIVWSEHLNPLGACSPSVNHEAVPSLMAGMASAVSIPVSLASSPHPSARDKKGKNKKAPAPTPSPLSTSFNGSSSYNSSSGGSQSGAGSPVLLRKGQGSPAQLRSSDIQRSRSVEGQKILQHPTQPPPKPPISRASEPGSRSSTEPGSRSSLDTPSPRVDSSRDLNENSLQSVTGVDKVHTVHGQIINTGGVYSVQGSLYPELEKLEIEAAEEVNRMFPVPAPRNSKPALPSKPEGLTRNMSVRTSGDIKPRESKDHTKL